MTKTATLLTIASLALIPSCTTWTAPAAPAGPGVSSPQTAPAAPAPGITVGDAYRGARHAAGAINTARTLGSVF